MRVLKIGITAILVVALLTGIASAVTIPVGKLKVQAIPSTPKVNETVRFIVTTEITNKPVADAEIWVARVGAKETVSDVIQLLTEGKIGKLAGYTDQNGEFKYRFDDWGVYVVQAKKEGYIESVTTVEVKPLGTLKVTTEKSEWSYSCTLSPEVLAKMTVNDVIAKCGKTINVLILVTDEHGNPIKNAEVFVNLKPVGYTNESGEINVGLKPGVYLITAKKKGYLPGAKLTVTVTEEDVKNKVEELINNSIKIIRSKIESEIKPVIIMTKLYPKYFVVGEGKPYEISAIVYSATNIRAVLSYSTDRMDWKNISCTVNPLTNKNILLNKINILIHIYRIEGTIPAQTAKTVVFYKFIVKDKNGNEAESLIGMYFVVNDKSNIRIAIIDPWVKLWLVKINAEKYLSIKSEMYRIGMGYRTKFELDKLFKDADRLEKFELIKRHYWENLGEFNFIIIEPDNTGAVYEFKPKVIILSNLLLSTWTVPQELIDYARQNHIGIIATHGTIFDEVLWVDTTRARAIEIGARGNVGETPDVYLRGSLGLMLGLYLSPAIEFAKNKIAEELCKGSYVNPYLAQVMIAAGKAIGSLPLHPAYIPFSGRMIVIENHEIVKGLGKEFMITEPTMAGKAYTTFGWQYLAPSKIINKAKENARAAENDVRKIYEKEFSEFLTINTPYKISSNYLTKEMVSSLNSELLDAAIDLKVGNGSTLTENGGYRYKTKNYVKKIIEFYNKSENRYVKKIIEIYKKYMPVKVIAVSDDGLAGIIVNNGWYGVRAVYFTFEPEASKDWSAWTLLKNSVLWSSQFKPKSEKLIKEWGTAKKLIEELIENAKKKAEVTSASTTTPVSTTTTATKNASSRSTPGFDAALAVIVTGAAAILRRKI